MYTVAFGEDLEQFEMFLKPLSARTGGSHYVSTLNQLDLCRAFTTIASSITTTRTSMTSASLHVPGSQCIQRFDSSCPGDKCLRSCIIKQLPRQIKAQQQDVQLRARCYADVSIDCNQLAYGGMRLVYLMEDSFNYYDKSRTKPMTMVAKRLIRKEGTGEHISRNHSKPSPSHDLLLCACYFCWSLKSYHYSTESPP